MSLISRGIFWRRLKADSRKGSAAIEFAVVGPIFFAFMLAIFETAIMFFRQSALQNAVVEMGRQIRTGQVANGGMSQGAFRTAVCNMVQPLIPCDANLQVDVESSSSGFSSFNTGSSPYNSDGTLNQGSFSIGNACDVVLLRGYYYMPLYFPGMNWFLVSANPGKDASGHPVVSSSHLVTAATAFRNEPYTTTTGGC